MKIIEFLKVTVKVTLIFKYILSLRVYFTVNKLLVFIPNTKKQLTKVITKNNRVKFQVNVSSLSTSFKIKKLFL